jgi:hypothetical protein
MGPFDLAITNRAHSGPGRSAGRGTARVHTGLVSGGRFPSALPAPPGPQVVSIPSFTRTSTMRSMASTSVAP